MRDVGARILIWTGVVACAVGFISQRMWAWLPAARFGESLLLAGLVALLAWPLRRWRGCAWADALGVAWLLGSVVMYGVIPALAVLVVVAGAVAIGSLVAGRDRPGLALLTGLAVLAGVAGWLLPLPVHRPWVYLPLLLGLAALRHSALRAYWLETHGQWRAAVDEAPRSAAWSVTVLGLAASTSWLPTMQYDDLAYHLGLPWQLMLHGRYVLDPTHQVWALAPWAGDVLQAIAQLIARTEARGALNLAWLLLAAAGLWRLAAQLQLATPYRWATLALFASLPTLAALLGGMQTELAAVAVTLGLATLVFTPEAGRRELLVGAALLGLLFGLKLLHVAAASGLLVYAAVRAASSKPRRASGATLVAAPLVTIGIGGSSYVYAAVVSGNPVLPLFNAVFRSPHFAATNFDDARWRAGFDAALPWELTFDTARYVEGWNGGAGFVLVALAGAWIASLKIGRVRALALCAAVAVFAPLAALQYARYAFVGIALVLPAAVASLQRYLPARAAFALLATVVVANLAFQTNAEGMLHTGAVKRAVLALGRDEPLFARYVPERYLAARIRARDAQAVVLDLSGAAHAEFAGRGRTAAWYSPRLQAARDRAEADPSGHEWAALLGRERISDVLVRPAKLTMAQRAGLARSGAHLQMTMDEAQWWHLPEHAR